MKIFSSLTPASVKARICRSIFWSRELTRAYPYNTFITS
nr:MAG TPA: hypothetical protein [Caudoviricetes sp.]